jgi:integrase
MRIRQQLVTIWPRASRSGKSYTYYLRFTDLNGKPRCLSLHHADKKKAEKQRAKQEKELKMGYCPQTSMRIGDFVTDSLKRTGDQILESTQEEYEAVVKDFINIMGNIDYQKVTIQHGEYYRQACIDQGNSKATVAKKLRHLKHLYKLAVYRKQIDENPFQYVSMPRLPKKKILIYSEDECRRMIRAAKEYISNRKKENTIRWDLLILTAIDTGMRRGSLLNLCWSDIDFDNSEINITPKQDTDETWEWCIKDKDERTVPLGNYTVRLLTELQSKSPPNYPYVFVPTARYNYIQTERRAIGNWTYSDSRLEVVNNFYRDFGRILVRAGIRKKGKFHDLRNTALSNWFAQGLTEFEVMTLAGHSSFETTHKFYLAIKNDYLAKAKRANSDELGRVLVE